MMTILVVKGCLLEGADKGINFYLGLEKFEFDKMLNIELWKDAVTILFRKKLFY
jgi:hypothetical protein